MNQSKWETQAWQILKLGDIWQILEEKTQNENGYKLL